MPLLPLQDLYWSSRFHKLKFIILGKMRKLVWKYYAPLSSLCEELLRITIDSELTFRERIISLCSRANQKLSALAIIAKFLTINKRNILLNSFIKAQFNYCPLIWMCHSTTLNSEINRIQEQTLSIFYIDYKLYFRELLERDHSFTIDKGNIPYLATESSKVKNGLSYYCDWQNST